MHEKNDRNNNTNRTFRSIRSKMIVSIIISMLIIMPIVGVVFNFIVSSNFNKLNEEVLKKDTMNLSIQTEQFFNKYIDMAEQLAKDKTVQEYILRTQAGDDMTKVEGTDEVFGLLKDVATLGGEPLLCAYIAEHAPDYFVDSVEGLLLYDNLDLSKKDYYIGAVDGGKTFITSAYTDMSYGGTCITIATPILVNGKAEGIIGIDIVLNELNNMISEATLGEEGYFTVVASDGMTIYHKNENYMMNNFADIGVSEEIVNDLELVNELGVTNSVKYNHDGKNIVGNSALIGDTGWKVVSAMPEEEYYAQSNQFTLLITIAFTIVGIIMAVLMFVLNGKLVDKMLYIKGVTDRLANGDLDVDFEVDSNDEIGELANSLGRLVGRLKSYINYINESTRIITEIANGNFKVEFEEDFTGEFAKLKTALDNQLYVLTEIMRKIGNTSDTITVTANQLSSSSQMLSQGANEQASTMEQLSAEINGISDGIDKSTELVKRTEEEFLSTAEFISHGNAEMKELIDYMSEIEHSSYEIGKIIKVIDDIAFQTNILALNANVEAARAGAAGKGFAVVADEVRNLANKSAEAAKQTSELIEKSMQIVQKGTKLANGTGKSLLGIVDKTENTKEMMIEIAKVSEGQAISVKQIKDGINQLTAVIQETAHNAESEAATGEELNNQASILKEIISNVKID